MGNPKERCFIVLHDSSLLCTYKGMCLLVVSDGSSKGMSAVVSADVLLV